MNADRADGPEGVPGRARLRELLAEAVRADAAGAAEAVDADAQREAVAAFRAACDAGAHRARTRRRDDWRPRERRSARISLKAAGGVVLAGGLLGGVALAAAGTVTDDPAPRERPRPAPSSPRTPGGPESGKDGVTPSRTEEDQPKPSKPSKPTESPEEPKPKQKQKSKSKPGQGKPKPPGQDRPKPQNKPRKPHKPPKPPKSENQGAHQGGHQDDRAKGRPHRGQHDPGH
ncbi:hypothetical protein JQK87_36595 [Streptomyces sp. G44]|uniref:hypothetical protein n=1 Tax=Streptomyces sp. G44 TaxID=2807632 RepID=UPI00195F4FE3|nr:hypothetical protein [Streptomyces sp. G44]MBM7173800.1 hypothetical protein [Streptomyces sp. G44]